MGEENVSSIYEAGASFNTRLKETLVSLLGSAKDCRAEVDKVKEEQQQMVNSIKEIEETAERENDLRKNEVRSLEARVIKNKHELEQELGKVRERLGVEVMAREEGIKVLEDWAKGENSARRVEIEEMDKRTREENEANKEEIATVEKTAVAENNDRKLEIAVLGQKLDSETSDREAIDEKMKQKLNEEVDGRKEACKELQDRMESLATAKDKEVEELRNKMVRENQILRELVDKPLSVYFDAYRSKAYDGGGEESLSFCGVNCNVGGGLDFKAGVFNCPLSGLYMFSLHIATHDNKKALLSLRRNGEEVASLFDQNHKDNHKNSMAGQTILLELDRGDEVTIYTYTGTWLADFPMNHYTHWVGMLLRPSKKEIQIWENKKLDFES